MKRKGLALLLTVILLLVLTACGKKEETTVRGMVTAVEGTVVSIVEMGGNRGDMDFEKGERPEGFDGTMPNGEDFPQWDENGEMPLFEGWDGQTPPTDEDGQLQKPSGDSGDEFPKMGNMMENMETTQVDIGDAHISVEADGVKAGGTLEDIKAGVFVIITKNGKGKVTNVLVTEMSGFGGGFRGGFDGNNTDGQQTA